VAHIPGIPLEALEVDERGLDDMDKRIITTIMDKFAGGPVGIGTLATAVGEEEDTIEEVYEPYLVQEGFLERTPRGREVTDLARQHFGILDLLGEKLVQRVQLHELDAGDVEKLLARDIVEATVVFEILRCCKPIVVRVSAIFWEDEEGSVSRVEEAKCMGCGLCRVTCPGEAIELVEVRPESFIP
jgi:ferredoxin